jgi:transposase InsO family protein
MKDLEKENGRLKKAVAELTLHKQILKEALAGNFVKLASEYGRYGYRRITEMLRAQGWRVNAKRVQRIWPL